MLYHSSVISILIVFLGTQSMNYYDNVSGKLGVFCPIFQIELVDKCGCQFQDATCCGDIINLWNLHAIAMPDASHMQLASYQEAGRSREWPGGDFSLRSARSTFCSPEPIRLS
jgi:hypothetical protein